MATNVRINAREVSPHEVQRLAEGYYKGGYFCDEAVMCAICDCFKLDVSEQVITMVSGMSVGVGKSGCMCGAANGGVAALGLLYGRAEQNGPQDPKVVRCMSLTHELHDWFRDNNGRHALCCRVLTCLKGRQHRLSRGGRDQPRRRGRRAPRAPEDRGRRRGQEGGFRCLGESPFRSLA